MSNLTNELKALLVKEGADLVGFADLSSIVNNNLNSGISVAVKIPINVIKSIYGGPTIDYYNSYLKINDKLDILISIGADFLIKRGYKAFAQTTNTVKEFDVYRTILPHKTVATNAGLGWIGKSALLVTEEYGSAVSISSLVSDAKFEYGVPITKTKCGNCMKCTDACPANAISGKLWSVEMDRDAFYNPLACRKKARELAAVQINKEITLCGKCIEICPYTKKYLSSENRNNL